MPGADFPRAFPTALVTARFGWPTNRQALEPASENPMPSSLDAHGHRGRSCESRGSVRRILAGRTPLMTGKSSRVNQCQNPTGWLGRLVLRNMNARHSKVTDWGLSHALVGKQDIILDVGCGGGRTVSKLAAIATQGKVYGIDHSTESVAMAMRTNRQWIDIARVAIGEASVSRLPFSDGAFGVITAVEKRTSGGLLCRRICLNF